MWDDRAMIVRFYITGHPVAAIPGRDDGPIHARPSVRPASAAAADGAACAISRASARSAISTGPATATNITGARCSTRWSPTCRRSGPTTSRSPAISSIWRWKRSSRRRSAWLDSVGPPRARHRRPRQSRRLCPRHQPSLCRRLRRLSARRRAGNGAPFPFVRRRGPLALIGLSTAVPTAPLMATGTLGRDQLDALEPVAGATRGRDGVPRAAGASSAAFGFAHEAADRFAGAAALLKRHGVELVLHGHDHIHSTMWFEGTDGKIPAIGVPSASALAHRHYPAAAYNLFSIERDGDAGAASRPCGASAMISDSGNQQPRLV